MSPYIQSTIMLSMFHSMDFLNIKAWKPSPSRVIKEFMARMNDPLEEIRKKNQEDSIK
jgi:hypothetical protein